MRAVLLLCLLTGLAACSSETPGVVSACKVESDGPAGHRCVETTAQASRESGGPDKRVVVGGLVLTLKDLYVMNE